MRLSLYLLLFIAAAFSPCAAAAQTYLGFDRNEYPGDDALPILRKTFSFASYWLSPPPGETTNTWSGKRELLRKNGFGFVVLFRGRKEKDLKGPQDAASKGEEDARATVDAGQREGFSPQTIVYLDIEEGGRLSPNYHRYIVGWLWHLTPAFRGGFYCSAIPVKEGPEKAITTCEDIHADLWRKSREFSLWAYNVVCPPSPGCAHPKNPPNPQHAGEGILRELRGYLAIRAVAEAKGILRTLPGIRPGQQLLRAGRHRAPLASGREYGELARSFRRRKIAGAG